MCLLWSKILQHLCAITDGLHMQSMNPNTFYQLYRTFIWKPNIKCVWKLTVQWSVKNTKNIGSWVFDFCEFSIFDWFEHVGPGLTRMLARLTLQNGQKTKKLCHWRQKYTHQSGNLQFHILNFFFSCSNLLSA